ncbi:MAG: AMP-binding protein, partial [Phycisphaeraceae bacterium]|nr:AMP-binding protein [Phycisphaeraceae bacterium]
MSTRVDLSDTLSAYVSGEIRSADVLARAEQALEGDVDAGAWHEYLEATGRPAFLESLEPDERLRWAETTYPAIARSNYTLETMLAARVREIPESPLFQDPGPGGLARWSYRQVQRRARNFAAVFLGEEGSPAPRVGLLVENSVDGACCDLACLLHDIFISPLNVHFDDESLLWVLDRACVDTIVVDTSERARRVLGLAETAGRDWRVYSIGMTPRLDGVTMLDEAVARLGSDEVTARLEARPRRSIHGIATVMFTSGSTGRPKGVAFSIYNLVTKRFARAAALPTVGRDEVMLCYLPLFHTFGRYLEMLGAMYWRGSYVFAGNPSAETLLALLQEVQPTGLISIPLRWVQIRDRALSREGDAGDSDAAFRAVVGSRLRWGLSAAGFLEPRVFRYFQRHGM